MMINVCQVSLNRDIPLIIENFKNFKKFYQNINFFVICPNAQLDEFKKKLNFNEIKIIAEDEILDFKKFEIIYDNLSKEIQYKEQFHKRLKWYYQQVLKITFAFNFISERSENIVIWDADTIILRKITFFKKNYSLKYGNFFESHKAYYLTNEYILKKLPTYFISSLNQFIAISKYEYTFFKDNFLKEKFTSTSLGEKIAEMIFKGIFNKHKIYNGSLFSEYELIGHSNNLFRREKQRPILFLRIGLDGILNDVQKFIAVLLGYVHVTYEHSHPTKKSFGMLNRTQTWKGFMRILLKNFFKFYLRYFKHILMYNFHKNK